MTDVTAIVSTYERTDKFSRALESVVHQTYEDLEVIVVDANEKKNYSEKVKSIVERYKETSSADIRLIGHQDSNGVSSDRNKGTQEAKGEYIAFLDDDDEWKPQKIEKSVSFIRSNEYHAVFNATEIRDGGRKVDTVRYSDDEVSLDEELVRDVIGSPSNVMISRETLRNVGGFSEDFFDAEDWELWIRVLKKGYSFGYLDEPLTIYNIGHESKSEDSEKAKKYRRKLAEKYSALISQKPEIEALHYLNQAKKQYELEDIDEAKTYLRKSLNSKLLPQTLLLYALVEIRDITGIDFIKFIVNIKRKFRK